MAAAKNLAQIAKTGSRGARGNVARVGRARTPLRAVREFIVDSVIPEGGAHGVSALPRSSTDLRYFCACRDAAVRKAEISGWGDAAVELCCGKNSVPMKNG